MKPLDLIMGLLLLAGLGYIGFYIYAMISGWLNIAKEGKDAGPPSVLDDCPSDLEKSGALCYKKCRKGFNRLAQTCWVNDVKVGVGTIPGKKPCDAGQRDDGTSCWEDAKCTTNCDSNWNWADGGYCHTTCGGCGCIKKTLMDRSDCGSNKDLIAGLCYDKCPAGMEHIPGIPTQCRPIGTNELSYTDVNNPGIVMRCPAGKKADVAGGLCYDDPGPGYGSIVGGRAYKDCPAGSKDIGLLCIPGLGDTPWYLSIYMLGAAVVAVGAALIYIRIRSIQAKAEGGGRTRKTKTRK